MSSLTSAADDEEVFTSSAGPEPLTWCGNATPGPVSLRSFVFVGGGEGDRDLFIQDFFARLEIDPATEGALRSGLCIVPSGGIFDSSAGSFEDGSGPMVNLDINN